MNLISKKNTFFSILAFVFIFSPINNTIAQKKVSISGYVKDAANGEAMIGVTVYIKELLKGATTNEYGFFSITIEEGDYQIVASFIGYKDYVKTISLKENIRLEVSLEVSAVEIGEVEIVSDKIGNKVEAVQMSVNKLNIAEISKMPALAGEVDLIKTVLTLPGVSSASEASAGFHVRGGGSDQNLILMDEAPIYNYSHLFGFFSIFNPDAVKDVQLIKGGIPARYSGRISSVLDIRLKEGNSKRFEATGGIATLFSRLTLEGPIVKDKSSFIISGRRSYIDLLAKPFLGSSISADGFILNFYDLSAKVNYAFNPKNTLYLSGYFGRDNFGFEGAKFSWGNNTATLRWNKNFGDKIFSNVNGIFSKYLYELNFSNTSTSEGFNWNSSTTNFMLKANTAYYYNTNTTFRFGISSLYYLISPANAVGSGFENADDETITETRISINDKNGLESDVYVEYEHSFSDKLKINAGTNLSSYLYFGLKEKYEVDNENLNKDSNGNVLKKDILSREEVQKKDIISSELILEPRLALNYTINNTNSLKLSYNRLSQNINLLSNTISPTPIDVWNLSSNNVPSQIGTQYALGYFTNRFNGILELSIEGYYKKTQKLIDFVGGADLLFNEFVDAEIVQGEGRAYGLEFFAKKAKGRFNGWVSYSYTVSERKVEGISNSEWFLSNYSKPHELNVVSSFKINKRWTLSSNFSYSTGLPYSFPTNRYALLGYTINHDVYNKRNTSNLKDNHRLDLSATLDSKVKPNKRYSWSLIFGLYNVYARKNPFSVYFQQKQDNPEEIEVVQISLIGSIVPSITYNFKF